MADPEQIYQEVLSEEQAKGVSPAVAEGRAKAARVRAEHGSPHPKEAKWWPGAQPHLEDGAAASAEETEEAPAAEPAEEAAAPAAEAEPDEAAAQDQQPAEAPVAPEAPAATEEQQAPQAPQEQTAPPAEPLQPAAATAPVPVAAATEVARPSGVTHGTATGTRLRPEDEVTTEAQFQGQQAMYERRKLIDELIATGVPAAAAADAGTKRSPMLALLYLLIPLLAIGVVLAQDPGGSGEAAAEATAGDEGGSEGELVISAANVQFDKQELTFPADQETTLTLNNEDSVEHNLSIYENEDAQQDLFLGPNVGPGASVDYDIPAMPEGEYFFRCDLHPTSMVGTVFVEAGGGEGGAEEGGGEGG